MTAAGRLFTPYATKGVLHPLYLVELYLPQSLVVVLEKALQQL